MPDPKYHLGNSDVEHKSIAPDENYDRWQWDRDEDCNVDLRFAHGLETVDFENESEEDSDDNQER